MPASVRSSIDTGSTSGARAGRSRSSGVSGDAGQHEQQRGQGHRPACLDDRGGTFPGQEGPDPAPGLPLGAVQRAVAGRDQPLQPRQRGPVRAIGAGAGEVGGDFPVPRREVGQLLGGQGIEPVPRDPFRELLERSPPVALPRREALGDAFAARAPRPVAPPPPGLLVLIEPLEKHFVLGGPAGIPLRKARRQRAGQARPRGSGERAGAVGELPEQAKLLVVELGRPRERRGTRRRRGLARRTHLDRVIAHHHGARDDVSDAARPGMDGHHEHADEAEDVHRQQEVPGRGVAERHRVSGVADHADAEPAFARASDPAGRPSKQVKYPQTIA